MPWLGNSNGIGILSGEMAFGSRHPFANPFLPSTVIDILRYTWASG